MAENVQQKVVEAYQVAAKGSFDHARLLLEETLYDHPNLIEAWLLMADLADDSTEARQCYQMVLEINPNNWVAQQRLKLLFSKTEEKLVSTLAHAQPDEPEEEVDENMTPESMFRALVDEKPAAKTGGPTLEESFNAHRKLVLSVGGGLLALLVLGGVSWLVSVGYIAWKTGFLILFGT